MFLVEEVYKLDQSGRWNPAFQMINLDTRKQMENLTLKAAKSPENRNLNRYRDVLPYDQSRVMLEDGSIDYINANFVEVPEIKRKYILTQGPLPQTCAHFWQMVWEQKSTAIIMLNKIIEKNTVKCHPYWPMGEGEVVEFGDFRIKNQSEVMASAYVIRDLQLEHIPSGKSRTIKHFHYMMWPDFGVPSSPTTFLKFLEDVMECGTLNDGSSPPVIHCSAGIGRSGTFCLVDSALEMVKANGKSDGLDLKQLLISLRKYRVGLIQTPDQLRFSYLAVIEGILKAFPDEFKADDLPFSIADPERKRKQSEDGEPPPLPPRKRAPPKPPSKQETEQEPKPEREDTVQNDSVAQEDLRQKKLVQSIQRGLEESSEGSEPDEVIDLSESEDDDHLEDVQGIRREEPSPSRKPLPALPAEKEEYSVNKPLPPLPPEDELEVKSGENREQEDDQPKLLPVLSIEEEEELEDTVTKPESSGEPTEKKRKISIQKSNSRTEIEIENSETKLEDDKCNESDTNRDTLKEDTKAENSTKTENEMSVGSKASESTELRRRQREDRKKETEELIKNIKKKMKDEELRKTNRAFNLKLTLALGICAGLFVLYYKFIM